MDQTNPDGPLRMFQPSGIKAMAMAGIAGYTISRVGRYVINYWREKSGLEPIAEEANQPPTIELSAVLFSALNPDGKMSAPIFGLAIGRLIEVYEGGIFRRFKVRNGVPEVIAEKAGTLEPHEFAKMSELKEIEKTNVSPWKSWDIRTKKIPDFLPRRILYELMARNMRELVVRDTYNRVTKQIVVAGYRHPSVVHLTRKILRDKNVDGHHPLQVGRAITEWAQESLMYAYDPNATGNEDFYVHPSIVVETMENGKSLPWDCDDNNAILLASMLLSVGHTPRWLLWSFKKRGEFEHITTALYLPKKSWKEVLPHHPFWNIEVTELWLKDEGEKRYDYWPEHVDKLPLKVSEER